MPYPGQTWSLDLKVVVCFFHTLAIGSGIFRSTYRWHISRFGWEDTWALLALFTDVGCLICSWLQQSISSHPSHTDTTLNWVAVATLTSVPWEARLSMIAAIIRITNPRPSVRRISYGIAIAFGSMWIAVLVLKFYDCATRSCVLTQSVAIFQLTADAISDAFLVFMPIFFLRGIEISQSQRVLLVSSFASSICITIVSVAQSVPIFLPPPINGISGLFSYIKAALSVVICNLLVVVTFTYRFYRKMDIDLGGSSIEIGPQFTTVVAPSPFNFGSCSCPTSPPSPCSYCTPSSRMETSNVSPIPTTTGRVDS